MKKPSPLIAALIIWSTALVGGPVFLFMLDFKEAMGNSQDGFWTIFSWIVIWIVIVVTYFLPSILAGIMLWIALLVLYLFKPGKWALLCSIAIITFLWIWACVLFFERFEETGDVYTHELFIAYWMAALLGVFWAFIDLKNGPNNLPH